MKNERDFAQYLAELAKACGFTAVSPLDVAALEFLPEVREMCAADRCRHYNKSWACPPACGDISECRRHIGRYKNAILVQTVASLEDALDGEGMMEAEARHRENFAKMYERLRKEYPNMLALGAGGCSLCEKCGYPDEPCRFPDKMTSSMEGYGMLVTQVCTAAGLRYYYGPMTIAYCGCFLLE